MFGRLGQLFSKKLQKVAHFVKMHEKSSIWPKPATSRANYQVSAFWSTFEQKVVKSGSFPEKDRKIIDLAQSFNFSRKQGCFGVWVNFSAKSCKKWGISRKCTKNHRFSETLNFSTKEPCFGALVNFSKKELKKVAHFVKKHEKSSIWPKLATFR